MKLTAKVVKSSHEAGRYGDGNGLYLVIPKTGGKKWVLRAQKNGRRRDIGLGSASKVSLALARKRAQEVREQIEQGIDPIAERKKGGGIPTFSEAVKSVHAENLPSWKNAKHGQQWINTLEAYAVPAFGQLSVADIDEAMVRDCLAAIWLQKPETAKRLRQRIRTVVDWSVAKGYRSASLAMPIIDAALPKSREKVKHHPALPYDDLARFLAHLRERESKGRLALEFAILTGARSGEVLKMTWDELDENAALWRIPAERMKAGRDHSVPLSQQAMSIVERMKPHRRPHNTHVFAGQARGKPQSDMTLTKVVRDLHNASVKAGGAGYIDPHENGRTATPHGFRSTFRDWVAEKTSYPRELAEAAIAHAVKGKAEAAYQRGTMLEKRRELMNAWGNYCDGAGSGNVVRMAR